MYYIHLLFALNSISSHACIPIAHTHARLTYSQVQAAVDGNPDSQTAPLVETIIKPLYGAYSALSRERLTREPLDLDLPEKKIILDDRGEVQDVRARLRLESHKLIEEFMITANVAAATALSTSLLSLSGIREYTVPVAGL